MRPHRFALLIITIAVSALVFGSIAHAADSQVGNWKLNVAKSKFSPGPAPTDGTLIIEAEPNGYKITVHRTGAQGKPIHYEMSP